MSIVVNTFFLILYMFFCYKYLKDIRLYVIPFFYLFLIQFWIVLSVYALDFGGLYMYELKVTSEKSFATTFLILSNMIFFHSLKKSLKKRNYTKKITLSSIYKFKSQKFQILSWLLFIIIGSYFFVFSIVGIPFFIGMDRATFSGIMNEIPGINFLWRNNLLISFLVGYTYAIYNRNGKSTFFPLIQFGLIILFLFLAGNRFSAIFSVCTAFLVAPILLGANPKISYMKLTKWGVLFLIFIISTTLLHGNTYSYSTDIMNNGEFLGYLFERIFILQGEIWWQTYDNIVVGNSFDANHIWVELRNIIGLDPGGYTGLRYLMLQAANGSFIYAVIEGDYLYTGAFPAIILATFNFPLFFIVLYLLGKCFAIVILSLQKFLKMGSLIAVYLIYIIYTTFNTMIITGGFDQFFTITNVFRILMLSAIVISIQSNRK